MSMAVTEDTPPDMLAGSMDLNVVLPNGKTVKMSIHRKTPMMDLLVQVTTAHHMSPGNYAIQAMGDRGVLPYKPSTPIGTLDAFTIKIVDKKMTSQKKTQVPQSFPNTFRLLVNLPKNQRFVMRVGPDVTVYDILSHVCTEKDLDMNKYELRSSDNPDQTLDLRKTLGTYKMQELSLVSKASKTSGGLMSSADIMHVKSSKQRQSSVCDSSLSSESIGSRSTSPVPAQSNGVNPPRPPRRGKKKPAPQPPVRTDSELQTKEGKKQSRSSVISHSRDSSDSSGYHEASVLSESPTHGHVLERSQSSSPSDTFPRQGTLVSSRSFGNLGKERENPRSLSVSSVSVNSICGSRKKRAAPQPPTDHLTRVTTAPVAEEKLKSSTLPTSRAEERIKTNVPFAVSNEVSRLSEDGNGKAEPQVVVEESITKVVDTVDSSVESEISVDSTKVDVAGGTEDEAKASPEVDEKRPMGKPVPKPRTIVPSREMAQMSRSETDSILLSDKRAEDEKSGASGTAEGTRPGVTLTGVQSAPVMGDVDPSGTEPQPKLWKWKNTDALACPADDDYDGGDTQKTEWVLGDSETSGNVSPAMTNNFVDWKDELPPPPTGFQDVVPSTSPELSVRTEESKDCNKPEDEEQTMRDKQRRESYREESTLRAQRKSHVMSELTNFHQDDRAREKSRSHTDLKAMDSCNRKNSGGLSYSKSFNNDLVGKGFKFSTYEANGAENDESETHANAVKYRNNKNLEKSQSMECIRSRAHDDIVADDRATNNAFPKPTAPVQKKVAKRSSSTAAFNDSTWRRSNPDLAPQQLHSEVLVNYIQQFSEFLKEKKLSDDLNMKSLSVIRDILPQINGCADATTARTELDIRKSVNRPKKTLALYNSDIHERIRVVVDKEENKDVPEVRNPIIKNVCPTEKYSYHCPPAINFSTWGERPKTRVLIKDEDYVTETKTVINAKSEKPKEAPAPASVSAQALKPPVSKKPNPLQFKKPGVKSHYEMFSALPRKKELTSLTLVQMEDEERKRSKMTEAARDPSRVPVVCGVELKKNVIEQQRQKSVADEATVKVVKPAGTNATAKGPQPVKSGHHSVSIYINGSREKEVIGEGTRSVGKPVPPPVFAPPKRFFAPVVKGFRTAPAPTYPNSVYNQSNDNDDYKTVSGNTRVTDTCNKYNKSNSRFKYYEFNSSETYEADGGSDRSGITLNGDHFAGKREQSPSSLPQSSIKSQKWEYKSGAVTTQPPPPPPLPPQSLSSVSSLSSSSSSSLSSSSKPEFSRVQLKPVTMRQVIVKSTKSTPDPDKDIRCQLMEEIRNFGYARLNSSKMKSAQ